MYLIPRRVLNPVEWDHVAVVGKRHVEVCKHLGFIPIKVGGVSQLTRDTSEERRRPSLMTRGGRALVGRRHCVVISK